MTVVTPAGTPEGPRADAWILKRIEQQPTWDLPLATDVGYIRSACTGMVGNGFRAAVTVMPLGGQGTPVHSNTGEHIIVHLEGEVEFEMQDKRWPIEPGDMLFIPADVSYAYFNRGRTAASFISVMGGSKVWPPEATYFDL